MPMKPIKFIYFDVGGVFLNWKKSLKKFANIHEKSEKEVQRVFSKYDNDFCRGLYTEEEMWSKYRNELKLIDRNPFDHTEFFTKHFVAISETHALAQTLSTTHSIGLLTNLHPGSFERIIKKGHIPNLPYKAVIKSYEVGFIKPEPEIYHIAQKKAGVAAEEILFIDDLEANIYAAQSLGWQGHVFDEDNPKKSIAVIKKFFIQKPEV